MYDVSIIGAGVIGCSIARELSKYNLNICVIEKDYDVACGTTKANSAIVHAGFDAKPDSLKGKLNAKGNEMFDKLSKELDFPFKRIGAFVLCFDNSEIDNLIALKEQGERNKVPGLKILDKEALKKLEPNISDDVVAGLYASSSGITCPYEMTISLAENAFLNGVEFKFDNTVVEIRKDRDCYLVKTNHGEIKTKLVINAAGIFADNINNLVSSKRIDIIPRKGEYCLFDKSVGNLVKKTIFQLPTAMGKGVLITPTVDGNLLLGPNAVDIVDKMDSTTSREGLDEIIVKGNKSVNNLPVNMVITSFSGLRAHCNEDDFIIGEAEDSENFINAAGTESPGLSSAPAIAEMVRDIVGKKIKLENNDKFNPNRKGILKFRELNNEERNELIKTRPEYGRIVCRCECVTEGEIIDSIRRPLGAKNLDAVKRRTRAGMGRCQSGFCSVRILEILSEELGIKPTEVTKFGGNSTILLCKNKESFK